MQKVLVKEVCFHHSLDDSERREDFGGGEKKKRGKGATINEKFYIY